MRQRERAGLVPLETRGPRCADANTSAFVALATRFLAERVLDPSAPIDRASVLDDIEDALLLAGDPYPDCWYCRAPLAAGHAETCPLVQPLGAD